MTRTLNTVGKMLTASSLFLVASVPSHPVLAATVPNTVSYEACVNNFKFPTLNTGNSSALGLVSMWGFSTTPIANSQAPANTCGMMAGGSTGSPVTVPGKQIEIAQGDILNLTLFVNMMTPQEAAATTYQGHTVHLHGADVDSANDGVPETSLAVTSSYKYVWDMAAQAKADPKAEPIGSFMYHCHVHTVKHLDMGMYGAILVRPKDALGATIKNQITTSEFSAFNVEQTYVVSAVDPAYHDVVAGGPPVVGDSPIFADYNPKFFLLNGTEGLTSATPASAAMLSGVAPGSKVALHLVDPVSVYGLFSIKDAADTPQNFTVYVEDGRAIAPVPTLGDPLTSQTSLEIGPGKRFDIIFTTPTTPGTLYPQIEFKNPRGETITVNTNGVIGNAMVYGKVTF
jgi:FtsP/CotA-like multicopper oxidase with cupredoxin domain